MTAGDENRTDESHPEAGKRGFFVRHMDQFTVAWLFLTRVPLPRWWNSPGGDVPTEEVSDETDAEKAEEKARKKDKGRGMIPLAATVRAWPLVGLFVGALAGAALWLGASLGLSPLAASVLGLAVAAAVTGALHEDGLADVADGFGGGADKAKRLRIMRDSRIGTFGVLTLLLAVAFKVGVLSGFTTPGLAAEALVAAHVLSRAVLPLMMVVLPPARRSGLGHGAGRPKSDDAVFGAAIGVLVAVLALGPGPGLAASALAGLAAAGMGWLAKRRIGGFTGDVLGAAQQAAEVLVLAGLAVALRTVFY